MPMSVKNLTFMASLVGEVVPREFAFRSEIGKAGRKTKSLEFIVLLTGAGYPARTHTYGGRRYLIVRVPGNAGTPAGVPGRLRSAIPGRV